MSSPPIPLPPETEVVFPHWPLAEPDGPPPPRVDWATRAPLCFVGGWEPLSFRKRAGYAWTDEDEAFAEEFSDAALDRYRAMGATSVVIPYAKGFGLQPTAGELEQAKDIVRRLHARRMRAAVYVRVDAFAPETMQREQPDVTAWLARDLHGRRRSYSPQQSFRQHVCFSHPGAVAYLEHLFRYAVEQLEADQLHLDGFQVSLDPTGACRCERCIASYRRWLRRRYPTPEAIEATFGVMDGDHLEPPMLDPDAPLPPYINSPDVKAWMRFQWEREQAFMRHVRRSVRSLSEQVAVSINPLMGAHYNSPIVFVQRGFGLMPWVDAAWAEDQLHLHFEAGRIVSRLGALKLAREANLPVCAYHWSARPGRTAASVALNIAANGGHVSCLGFTFRYLPNVRLDAPIKQRMATWTAKHWHLLGNTLPLGEIGLLRHHESLAWSGVHPWQALAACESLLTQMHVPWRVLDRVKHPALEAIGTLIAADAESLSDEELAHLRQWVLAGGRLLFTARSGQYDQDRRRRPHHPIRRWVEPWRSTEAANGPSQWFAWLRDDVSELMDHAPPERSAGDEATAAQIVALGKGQLGWWPMVRVAQRIGKPHRIGRDDMRPPIDATEMASFIRTLHGPFALHITAPPQVLAEFNRVRDTGDRLIHLIRTNDAPEPAEVTIHLRLPAAAPSAECLSPDATPPVMTTQDSTIRITGLDRYAVVHLRDSQEQGNTS